MVGFVDTSCLAALAFDEPGSRELRAALLAADSVTGSMLLEAELQSACAREGIPGAVPALLEGVELIPVVRRLAAELTRVLAAGWLRGADAWHLAVALHLDPSASAITFWTLDKAQADVARALGFRVAPD